MSNFVLKYLNPIDYFAVYYDSNIRPDNRELSQYRDVKVQQNCFKSAFSSFGSSSVRLGDTAVTCGINYSIGTPDVSTPASGEVRVNVTLGAIASSSVSFVSDTQVPVRSNQKSDSEHELETFLQKVLTASKLIDVHSLLIQEGQYALRLEINIVVLSNCGNVHDACVISMMKALQCATIPVLEVDMGRQDSSALNTNVQLAEDQSKARPVLEQQETLTSITCGVFFRKNMTKPDSETSTVSPQYHILYDLTLEEATIADHIITAVFNEQSELVLLNHRSRYNGSVAGKTLSNKALPTHQLLSILEKSQKQAEYVNQQLYER